MLRWLPSTLVRLYRLLIEARAYARTTCAPGPVTEPMPETTSGPERQQRLHIVFDAFCERRPPPRILFCPPSARRDLTSWCDRPHPRNGRRNPRCPTCAKAHKLYAEAVRGDWKAECALYTLARKGAVRLCAERRRYAHERADLLAALRAQRRPEEKPPNWPALRLLYGDRPRRLPPWHIQERQDVERSLLQSHAMYVRALTKRRRARLREIERECTAPAHNTPTPAKQTLRGRRQADVAPRADVPPRASEASALLDTAGLLPRPASGLAGVEALSDKTPSSATAVAAVPVDTTLAASDTGSASDDRVLSAPAVPVTPHATVDAPVQRGPPCVTTRSPTALPAHSEDAADANRRSAARRLAAHSVR